MQIKEFLSEERAVSPVIGVILMVAITVILAAVIGTFVLGLGQNVQSTPSASFSFDYNPSASSPNLAVTHDGGDALTGDNTKHVDIVNSGSTLDGYIADTASGAQGGNANNYWASASSPSSAVVDLTSSNLNAGSTAFVAAGQLSSGDTVRVIYIGKDDNSATLASFDVPS